MHGNLFNLLLLCSFSSFKISVWKGHFRQENNVCFFFVWRLRLPFVEKDLLHKLHVGLFSSTSLLIPKSRLLHWWRFNFNFELKLPPQVLQWNLLLFVLFICFQLIWFARLPFLGKALLQWVHVNWAFGLPICSLSDSFWTASTFSTRWTSSALVNRSSSTWLPGTWQLASCGTLGLAGCSLTLSASVICVTLDTGMLTPSLMEEQYWNSKAYTSQSPTLEQFTWTQIMTKLRHNHQSRPFENVDVLVVDEHLLPLGAKQLQHLGHLGEEEGGVRHESWYFCYCVLLLWLLRPWWGRRPAGRWCLRRGRRRGETWGRLSRTSGRGGWWRRSLVRIWSWGMRTWEEGRRWEGVI